MTHRKSRQSEHIPPEDRLLAEVQAIAIPPLVVSVEEHFAGYFNELGITLRLAAEATDQEIVVLRNNLLGTIARAASELKIDFTWLVSMYRGPEQVVLLFPGDSAIPEGHPLEQIYRAYAQNPTPCSDA